MFRVMQAEVDNLKLIAVEDLVRSTISTMVFINHICHVILKIRSAPWGSFRTPRRERLMADIGILSMLCESTAIVSVKALLYLYQFIYFQNASLLKLLHEFTVYTSVPLVIFYRCILGHRDLLSEYSSYGCLAQKMKKIHFGCKYFGSWTWAL